MFYAKGNEGAYLLLYQVYAILFTIAWCSFFTISILLFLKWTIGLRVTEEEEEKGLDRALHDETVIKAPAPVADLSMYPSNVHGGDFLSKLNLERSDTNVKPLSPTVEVGDLTDCIELASLVSPPPGDQKAFLLPDVTEKDKIV